MPQKYLVNTINWFTSHIAVRYNIQEDKMAIPESIKSVCRPSNTRVKNINGISNILDCRLRKLMKDTGVSKNYSTKKGPKEAEALHDADG